MTQAEMDEIIDLASRGVAILSRERSIQIETLLAEHEMTIAELRREVETAEAEVRK